MNCDRPLNAKKWGSKQRGEAGWGQSGAPARAFPLPLCFISLCLGLGSVLSERNPFVLEGGVGCCRAALTDTSAFSKTPVKLSACWVAGMAGACLGRVLLVPSSQHGQLPGLRLPQVQEQRGKGRVDNVALNTASARS